MAAEINIEPVGASLFRFAGTAGEFCKRRFYWGQDREVWSIREPFSIDGILVRYKLGGTDFVFYEPYPMEFPRGGFVELFLGESLAWLRNLRDYIYVAHYPQAPVSLKSQVNWQKLGF